MVAMTAGMRAKVPTMDLPRQLGPFRLLKRLGYGGMAEVFLAVAHGASGFEKRVAIKTLLPEFRGDGEYERLLIDEAVRAARFSHKNIVSVQDLGNFQGTYYVRMDWVDGADLAALLERGAKPTVPLALYVLEEVASALAYLHALTDDEGRPLGLVHRDVSPSNVLVSRAGEVKLGDFGIARATMLAEVTRSGVRKGKYASMAPEQVAGGTFTAASDQFAFGVTAHEMFLGRRPYEGATPLVTMEKIRECTAPDLSALDVDVASLVGRCLQRDPRQRFKDAESLRATIATARRTREPVSATDVARWVT
jgi:serine/threonine-protein kinase